MANECIAIIPARGGSKGLAKKNIKLLGGVHLIGRPIQAIQCSGIPIDIYVTTDSQEIQEIAKRYGAECPFLRDPNLAGDEATTEDTLKDALDKIEAFNNRKYKYAMFMTATDVFREPEWIKECYEAIENDEEVESVLIGYETTKNYWERQGDRWVRVCDWMRTYGSRQTRRSIVREDTGVCSISKAELWRKGRRIGDKVKIITKKSIYDGLDIHTQYDLDVAEFTINYEKRTGN